MMVEIGGVVPRRNTRFFAFTSCSRSAAAIQIFTLCPTCCAAFSENNFGVVDLLGNNVSLSSLDRISSPCTCNLAASSQTSSLFRLLIAALLDKFTRSNHTPRMLFQGCCRTINQGRVSGLDLMSESNSIRARLMSPISSFSLNDLTINVRYPFGSMDVAEPDIEAVPETWTTRLKPRQEEK